MKTFPWWACDVGAIGIVSFLKASCSILPSSAPSLRSCRLAVVVPQVVLLVVVDIVLSLF